MFILITAASSLSHELPGFRVAYSTFFQDNWLPNLHILFKPINGIRITDCVDLYQLSERLNVKSGLELMAHWSIVNAVTIWNIMARIGAIEPELNNCKSRNCSWLDKIFQLCLTVNPFPHTTILQQTTFNIFCKQIENLYNWMNKLWLKVKNIVAKGEIARFE